MFLGEGYKQAQKQASVSHDQKKEVQRFTLPSKVLLHHQELQVRDNVHLYTLQWSIDGETNCMLGLECPYIIQTRTLTELTVQDINLQLSV